MLPDANDESRMDPDQLQNMIDMALADTYDLVSSWLPDAPPTASDAILAADNALFEKMAFRPARLGLGATAPAGVSRKDDYKLKQRLVGNRSNVELVSDIKGKAKAEIGVSDEEDSKSRIVSKKSTGNGFPGLLSYGQNDHTKKKRKKRKKDVDGTIDDEALLLEQEEEWHGLGDITPTPNSLDLSPLPSHSGPLSDLDTTLSPPSSATSILKSDTEPSFRGSESPMILHSGSEVLGTDPDPIKRKRKRKREKAGAEG